jgi:putative component of toxin-antitoxin plasmid stabilization module
MMGTTDSGIRIYCGKDGNRLIVLICGGDKAYGKKA